MSYSNNKAWRLAHPEYRRKERRKYYSKTSFAPNGGMPVTLQEIEMIMAHSIPDQELALKIGRSVAAIQKIRWQNKKVVN